jgi:hypothetical protein
VSYNGYTGFSQAARNWVLDANQYTTVMNERYANGYVQSLTIIYTQSTTAYGKGTSGKMLFLLVRANWT